MINACKTGKCKKAVKSARCKVFRYSVNQEVSWECSLLNFDCDPLVFAHATFSTQNDPKSAKYNSLFLEWGKKIGFDFTYLDSQCSVFLCIICGHLQGVSEGQS